MIRVLLLVFGIVCLPFALATGEFTGLSLLGVLAITLSILLTIFSAPPKKERS